MDSIVKACLENILKAIMGTYISNRFLMVGFILSRTRTGKMIAECVTLKMNLSVFCGSYMDAKTPVFLGRHHGQFLFAWGYFLFQ